MTRQEYHCEYKDMTIQEKIERIPAIGLDIPDDAIRVTRESFYSTIGNMDVTAAVIGGEYDNVIGYTSKWRGRDDRVFGWSDCGTTFAPYRYFVTPSFFRANNMERVTP